MTFYQRFVQLSAERGMSPSKAATEAGLSRAAVSLWSNKTQPSRSALLKLSKFFGIPVRELIKDVEFGQTRLTDSVLAELYSETEEPTDDYVRNSTESDLLSYFRSLTAREQILFMAEIYRRQEASQKEKSNCRQFRFAIAFVFTAPWLSR